MLVGNVIKQYVGSAHMGTDGEAGYLYNLFSLSLTVPRRYSCYGSLCCLSLCVLSSPYLLMCLQIIFNPMKVAE